MNNNKILATTLILCTILLGCNNSVDVEQKISHAADNVVTKDIQEGIEKHIRQQTRLGDGHFRIHFDDKELKLKLVRVHTEYLANLGPDRHFACVDLAGIDGDVYDVDFFLKGPPGNMTVTETTVHKFNGQPRYVWKQKSDKTWHRFDADKAPPKLLGVISGTDEFEFIYKATLPKITESAQMWLPIPTTDEFQTVWIKSIEAPGEQKMLHETEHGNKVLFLSLGPEDSRKKIDMRFLIRRHEKPVYKEKLQDVTQYLKPEQLVPTDEKFSTIAQQVVEGKDGDLVRARALYDHVIDRMRYMKYGTGWGKGDAVYACDTRTGNCTDFHSYFIALSRSVGIPARFAIGAAIPSERNSGGIDGYHCWAEFYTDQRWWPVDISEGDKCSSLSTYYFGHHPANRIELSRGRDLQLNPGPASGPINFLAYPVLEINGKPTNTKVTFSFNRKI